MKEMCLTSFGISDIGLNRPNNEDVWAALPDMGFFALADGMGGHLAGEVAAKEAIDSLLLSAKQIQETSRLELVIEMRLAIEKANQWIYQMSRSSSHLQGMGTTLCCLKWTQDWIIYAHIGDSRIYRLHKKKLELLTKDHSLFAKWLSLKELTKTTKTRFPYKNIITRALGTSKRVKPEIGALPHEIGDLYLLCTDGLHDVLTIDEMEEMINQSEDLETICKNLIEMAKFKRSSDNMTVLMIRSEPSYAKNLSGQ